MKRSIDLSPEQRTALLDRYRKDPDPEVRFRAHILLLLADGHTWATVAALWFCRSRTIDRGGFLRPSLSARPAAVRPCSVLEPRRDGLSPRGEIASFEGRPGRPDRHVG